MVMNYGIRMVLMACGIFLALQGRGQALDEIDCKALLVRAEARLNSFEQYQCSLEVKSMTLGAVPETGVFQFSKGRYRLDFHEDESICTGDSMMTWYKAFGQVMVEKWTAKNDLSLAGILRLYENHNAEMLQPDEVGIIPIKLVPKDEKDVFIRKEIRISAADNRVVGYSIFSNGYGNFNYRILDEVISPQADESLFRIDYDKVAKIRSGEIPPVEHPAHEEDHEGHDH